MWGPKKSEALGMENYWPDSRAGLSWGEDSADTGSDNYNEVFLNIYLIIYLHMNREAFHEALGVTPV